MADIIYQWAKFDDLERDLLYEILQLRQKVFVLEQSCLFLDADGLDQEAWHFTGRLQNEQRLLAYLRVLPPSQERAEVVLGRLLVCREKRGKGFGRKMMVEVLKRIDAVYPGRAVKVCAQSRLKKFYESFGFKSVSQPYDEDGIEHIDMIKDGTYSESLTETGLRCLNAAEMKAFSKGYCSEKEKEAYLKHLKQCSECYQKYMALMMFSIKEQGKKEHGRGFLLLRSRLSLMALGCLLALLVAGWAISLKMF